MHHIRPSYHHWSEFERGYIVGLGESGLLWKKIPHRQGNIFIPYTPHIIRLRQTKVVRIQRHVLTILILYLNKSIRVSTRLDFKDWSSTVDRRETVRTICRHLHTIGVISNGVTLGVTGGKNGITVYSLTLSWTWKLEVSVCWFV